jgi:hypothetical protein
MKEEKEEKEETKRGRRKKKWVENPALWSLKQKPHSNWSNSSNFIFL